MISFREHPLRILRYSMKNIWLLIFPLLRGVSVMHFDPAGFYAWIQGAWMDIAVLGVIILYGFIRWYFSWVEIDEGILTHREGVLVRIVRSIPFDSMSSVSAEIPFYYVPIRAVKLRCDTRAGIFSSADLKIVISQKDVDTVMAHIPDIKKEKAYTDLPKPSITSVMLFSVFFSSGFSGTVYIAAFLVKGGDIARDIVNVMLDRITEQAEHIYIDLLSGIPKAAAMAAMFFVGSWLLSFIMNLLRYSRFELSADKSCIKVYFGLIKRRKSRIRVEHINYIDVRQNLIMKLCGAVTVNISCPGYGCDSHLPVLMPIGRAKNFGTGGKKWGVGAIGSMKYRPKYTSFLSYAGLPFFGVLIVTVLYGYSDRLPHLADLSLFLVIMADIPLAWLTMVKTAALLTSGISLKDGKLVIRCSKGTSFHTVVADQENVVAVQLRQSIIQKLYKKCNVVIWLCGESRSRYKVNALPIEQGREIAGSFGTAAYCEDQ